MTERSAAAGPDEAPAFLDSSPPHWAASGLSWVLLVLVVAGALAAVLIEAPERVSSRFVLVPVAGTDPVRALRDGRVRQVLVREGESVAKSSRLFVVQSVEVSDRSTELGTLEARLDGLGVSRTNAAERYRSQRRADEEEGRRLAQRLEHLERMLVLGRESLALRREEEKRYETLVRQGVAQEQDLFRRRLERNQAEAELEKARADREETTALGERLRHEMAARAAEEREITRSLAEEEQRIEIRSAGLRGDLSGSVDSQEVLVAPCDGTILGLRVKAAGAVVTEGEALCDIACADERFHAELTLPQSGLDRIKVGQEVRLLYDAFPYQRYGVKLGRVSWLSPASVGGDDGAAFHAFVELADESIVVAGQSRRLQAGMGGRADVVVGRRRLIVYALEPLRRLGEGFGG